MNLNSLSLVVDFGHLPTEGFAALILAIIFTIISFSLIIYYFKHKDIGKAWLAVIILALPALSIFCWVYLIISVVELGIGACFYISFACAIGYVLIMLALGLILNKCLKNNETEEESEETTEEVTETEEVVEEPVEETTEETENEETAE